MPNLIPDSVLGFELGWAQPAGRLLWASLIFVIGVAFVVTLIKPPLEHKVLTPRRGVPMIIGLVVVSYVIGALLDPIQTLMVWVSLFGSVLLALTMVASRDPRPPERKTTWSEAMLGAVAVFFLMTLAYGVIPHEWITFSDKYLQWTPDKIFIDTYPVKVPYEALRDFIVVGIYAVMLGLNVRLFVLWQDRLTPKAEAEGEAKVSRFSRFGRPLRARVKAKA
jgi:hypothetical protein